MDWDEPKPKTSKAITIGEDLKALSIAELNERIVTCRRNRADQGRAAGQANARRRPRRCSSAEPAYSQWPSP